MDVNLKPDDLPAQYEIVAQPRGANLELVLRYTATTTIAGWDEVTHAVILAENIDNSARLKEAVAFLTDTAIKHHAAAKVAQQLNKKQ